MIRIYKCLEAPKSLTRLSSWNGEDVNAQLKADQHGKCYLCERRIVTDYQVEHVKCRAKYPDFCYEWSNLLWACSYCNMKKSDSFDGILNPMENDVECLISHKMDFPKSVAVFKPVGDDTDEKNTTIKLLSRIFNGTGKMRTLREQQLYDYAKSRITSFQQMVISWLIKGAEDVRKAIIEELEIQSEFLGFKYWIIQSNDRLYSEFGPYIIWNKKSVIL